MRNIVVFDFDGTITQKDTLLEFIKYAKGKSCFYLGFFLHIPFLLAYKMGLYPNWKIKQQIFTYFFKGMKYEYFCQLGIDFIPVVSLFIDEDRMNSLEWHKQRGDKIYIVTASIKEWVEPWCKKHGIENVLATLIEVDENGYLTGRLKSKNCFGSEKVKRFIEVEPNRESYFLYAYGDSAGDREIINFSDKGIWCK